MFHWLIGIDRTSQLPTVILQSVGPDSKFYFTALSMKFWTVYHVLERSCTLHQSVTASGSSCSAGSGGHSRHVHTSLEELECLPFTLTTTQTTWPTTKQNTRQGPRVQQDAVQRDTETTSPGLLCLFEFVFVFTCVCTRWCVCKCLQCVEVSVCLWRIAL